MPKFNKICIENLKAFLYNSYIHDAEIKNVEYNLEESSIKIEILNSFYNAKYEICLHNINAILMIKGDWSSSKNDRITIASLTAEDALSILQTSLQLKESLDENCIYLIFQMLSGDETHIAIENVMVEEICETDGFAKRNGT